VEAINQLHSLLVALLALAEIEHIIPIFFVAENLGHDEIQETPELTEIILQWSSS
jgi:hypothetical protein